MSDSWRENLEKALHKRGVGDNLKKASKDAGLGETAVFDILRRHRDPQMSTMVKLAKAHSISLDEIVEGTVAPAGKPVRLVPVRGRVAAGFWFDSGEWDEPVYEDVPVVNERYKSLPQEAFFVVGDSMDKEGIVDGSFVTAVVPYWLVREHIQNGDVVVVEQQDAGRIERTVKVVAIMPDHYRLEARSTNPKWRDAAIIIPRGNRDDADDRRVEVIGLVTGTYRRFGG